MPDLPLSAGVSTSLNLHTDQSARKENAGNATESFETVLRGKVKQSGAQAPEAAVTAVVGTPKTSSSSPSDAGAKADNSQAPVAETDKLGVLEPALTSLLLQLQSSATGKVEPDNADTDSVDNSSQMSNTSAWLAVQGVDQTQASFTVGQAVTTVARIEPSDSVTSDPAQLPITTDPAQLPITTDPAQLPISADQQAAAAPSLTTVISHADNQTNSELSLRKLTNARPTNAVAQALSPIVNSTQNSDQMASAGNASQANDSGPGASMAPLPVAKSSEPLPTATDQANHGSGKSEFAHLLDRAGASLVATQQQPVTQSTQGTNAVALQQPAGHAAWQNELGDKMVWMANSQRQQADLVLNPPQLGRVEVSLTISGDQASAVFASPNAAVREMLENSLPRLREIFAGAGIDLGEAQVNTGQSQQQGGDNRGYAGDSRDGGLRTMTLERASTSVIAEANTTWSSGGRGLVDTFA